MSINYITPQGLDKLCKEQENLLRVERPKVVKTVTWAASLGDRSENADYHYGKKRLREIDRRLRYLKKRIEMAEVVDPKLCASSKIQFGAKVLIETEKGLRRYYTIVGEDEISLQKGRISWKSPIGKSLLGKEKGDFIVVKTPEGEKELEVLEILYSY
ncbi:MAG: transcription elongation factor GreB [Bdellovibrionales bacterium]|nr:transcription elongation factor GreB [Bdellovibrionales bacterium]